MSDWGVREALSTHPETTLVPASIAHLQREGAEVYLTATSAHSQRSGVTTSDQSENAPPASINQEVTQSQSGSIGISIERMISPLTGPIHNGEDNESSPWARKTILSLGELKHLHTRGLS